jgi:uncharacterized protein YfdQ (DUF2303 family)
MEETPVTEAQAIATLAINAAGVRKAADEARPFVILAEDQKVEDLERHLQAPTRRRGTLTLRDVASFVAAVKAHASDSTTLYRTVEPPQFVAVFNDHHAEHGPGWGDHRAVYACPLSPEWKAWKGSDKRQMQQAEFAQFVEDNLPDVVEPPAAAMLEIARTLQAKKKVNFASGIRLDNGETQFTYEEKIDGSAGGKGQFKVPEVFKIGVPVFEGGDSYAVNARLRYRITDQGGLIMWFDLERPHKIVEDAVEQMRKQIETETGRPTLNGARD